MPTDENPDDKGYLIKQDTGHETWQPKKEFEKDYELADDMMVTAGDNIARKNTDNTLTPYEVICADTKLFIIAPLVPCGPDIIAALGTNDCNPDYKKLEVYSNDKSIMTLEEMNFIKLEDK